MAIKVIKLLKHPINPDDAFCTSSYPLASVASDTDNCMVYMEATESACNHVALFGKCFPGYPYKLEVLSEAFAVCDTAGYNSLYNYCSGSTAAAR